MDKIHAITRLQRFIPQVVTKHPLWTTFALFILGLGAAYLKFRPKPALPLSSSDTLNITFVHPSGKPLGEPYELYDYHVTDMYFLFLNTPEQDYQQLASDIDTALVEDVTRESFSFTDKLGKVFRQIPSNFSNKMFYESCRRWIK